MDWPVVLTAQSQEDLQEIVVFIARNNPERARTFGHTLIDKATALGAHPEMGRVVPEVADAAVRESVHGNYRIIYELTAKPSTVYILRFWHGARGQPEVEGK